MKDSWTFLTNHAHTLLYLTRSPEATMREVSLSVGITERAVQKIVSELVAGGYLTKEKQGRRNVYELIADQPLRHPLERHCTVQNFLAVLVDNGDADPEDGNSSS